MSLLSKLGAKKLQEKIFDGSMPEPNSGCWLWFKAQTSAGYGMLTINYAQIYAHRLSYLAFKGTIPLFHEIDHKCRLPCCVNPDHLEAVTHKVNCQRGIAGKINARRMKAKTHCPQGHPYSGENLYTSPKGYRGCRICRRESSEALMLGRELWT